MSQVEINAAKLQVEQSSERLDRALDQLADYTLDVLGVIRHPVRLLELAVKSKIIKNRPIKAWSILFLGGLVGGLVIGLFRKT